MPQSSFNTFLGTLSLAEDDGAIVSLDWGFARDQDDTALLSRARDEVFAYLAGELRGFSVPQRETGSVYQCRVWQALRDIPFGQTRTYAQLALAAGGSARSVGGAIARNPLPILIPCHRVLAATGPGGYSSGDGLATKRALLCIEGVSLTGPGASSLASVPSHIRSAA